MKMSSFFFIFCVFLLTGHFVNGEVVRHQNCSEDENAYPCVISEVRIEPCKEASKNLACKVKRGTTSTISFDYTPDFSGNVSVRAFWVKGNSDLPFNGMDTNGCKSSECPVVQGENNVFLYSLYLAKTFPLGQYDVKWKIWNEENKECCMITKIKLTK